MSTKPLSTEIMEQAVDAVKQYPTVKAQQHHSEYRHKPCITA